MKPIASAIAFVLTFLLFLPYIRAIWRRTVVPHVFSWVIWAFGTFVVFLAQLADGGGIGAWPIGFSACITAYIAYLSYRVRAHIDIARFDWVLLVFAFAAIPGWAIASDPFWAVLFLTSADLIGFGPTIRKAYAFPHQEHIGFFAVGALRNSFVVLALEHYSWTTVLFPAAVGIACVLVVFFLLARRAVTPASTEERSSVAYRLIETTRDDEAWLDRLRRAVYQDLFVATWGGWDEDRHQRHFSECLKRGEIRAIEYEGARVGMIQLFEQPDGMEVGEIQVEPKHQGRGIGAAILQGVIDRAHAQRKTVVLSTGLKNQRALALYLRLGFVRVSRSETHEHLECKPRA